MKFQIGDKVRVKTNDHIGVIDAYRTDGYILKGVQVEVAQYRVDTGKIYNDYYKEDQIEFLLEVSDKFELTFLDFLIDMNLKDGQLEMVKNFNEQKMKFT